MDIISHSPGEIIIHNPGPEPVPAKLITYASGRYQQPEAIDVCYIEAGDKRHITTTAKSIFLVYSEERIIIPLHTGQQPRALRNQQHHALYKEEAGEAVTYILPRAGEIAWRLTGVQRAFWELADGMTGAEQLRATDSNAYDEMLAQGLIIEIP
ncbi:hypothetical protein [Paraflavitalea speifideaquila]|uniref:hypothetical protein n=1 Tax=Paraflavitalea speifideaquila TaxID=3076558 RepID=UPI0028E3A78A|nr:hypothetical protein [Paraflavitalea speifideiaquila]